MLMKRSKLLIAVFVVLTLITTPICNAYGLQVGEISTQGSGQSKSLKLTKSMNYEFEGKKCVVKYSYNKNGLIKSETKTENGKLSSKEVFTYNKNNVITKDVTYDYSSGKKKVDTIYKFYYKNGKPVKYTTSDGNSKIYVTNKFKNGKIVSGSSYYSSDKNSKTNYKMKIKNGHRVEARSANKNYLIVNTYSYDKNGYVVNFKEMMNEYVLLDSKREIKYNNNNTINTAVQSYKSDFEALSLETTTHKFSYLSKNVSSKLKKRVEAQQHYIINGVGAMALAEYV